jgi:hypothetical protein
MNSSDTSWILRTVLYLYELTSQFGTDVKRALAWVVGLNFAFFAIYVVCAMAITGDEFGSVIEGAARFALKQMFHPFAALDADKIAAIKPTSEAESTNMFLYPSLYLGLLGAIQSLVSIGTTGVLLHSIYRTLSRD